MREWKYILLNCLLISLSTCSIVFISEPVLSSFVPAAKLITLMGLILLNGILALPKNQSLYCTASASVLWCMMLATATLLSIHVSIDFNFSFTTRLLASYGVFSISFLMQGFIRILQRAAQPHHHPALLVLFLFIASSAFPLSLSPWLDLINPSQEKLQLILWSSPLTYFACMLSYDYLHSQWFYQFTSYAMYRFNYPDPFWFSIGLNIMAYLLHLFSHKNTQQL